ncbi:hypothetical protein Tco_1356685 [Tanacetum coccineum]
MESINLVLTYVKLQCHELRATKPKRKDTQIPQSSGHTDNVTDETVSEEMDDSLERASTTATSLDAEQDRGNINKTQSKATPNEVGSQGTTSGGGPSGEDSLKLNELMELCINLEQRVLDLETTKTTQANEIASLKRRVKKLERRNKSRTHGLKRMYRVGLSRRVESIEDEGLGKEDASKQGRIADNDSNKDIYLVNVHINEDMFGVNDLDSDEVIVDNVDVVKTAKETRSVVEEVTVVIEKAKLVNAAEETVNDATITISISSTIPVSATITITTTATITNVEITMAQALAELKSAKPKAVKVVIQEPEQGTTTTSPTTIISVPKPPQDKGKGIMIEEPVVEQVKTEADCQLAQRLQAQEQEELTDEEKARLVNTFVDYKTELVEENSKKAEVEIAQESSSKRAEDELEQENAKKQKVDEDKETVELQSLMEVIPDEEEVAIDVVPLATKPPTIVDWKIHKEGKKSYYQIIRADEKSQMYRVFSQMLKSFSREDLEDLYKLVKAKYGSTKPVEDLDLIIWGDLKTMFEPHVEDTIWRNQQNYSNRYPLTPSTVTDMLNKKLQADHFSEMAYQLLKLLTKQLKN